MLMSMHERMNFLDDGWAFDMTCVVSPCISISRKPPHQLLLEAQQLQQR